MSDQITIQVECPCSAVFKESGEAVWVRWRADRWIEAHSRAGCSAFPVAAIQEDTDE